MREKLPPRLEKSLRRIDDYCNAIRDYYVQERLVALEAAQFVRSESKAIVEYIEEEE